MKFERNLCFTRPCDGCEIATLSTANDRVVGAQGVDFVLKHASIIRPVKSDVEALADQASAEYCIPEAKSQIEAAVTRRLDGNCPSVEA